MTREGVNLCFAKVVCDKSAVELLTSSKGGRDINGADDLVQSETLSKIWW